MLAASSRSRPRRAAQHAATGLGTRRRGSPDQHPLAQPRVADPPPAEYVLEVGPEAVLHAAWRLAAGGTGAVRTRDGNAYRVIYVGRPSDGPGPDFRDAVLQAPGGELIRGDIEIHVRAAGWHEHGHGTDRRYNGVVFHVASEGRSDAVNSSGTIIPLVVLPAVNSNEDAGPEGLAQAARGLSDLVPDISVAEAGDHRFLAKSSGFQVALRLHRPDDVIWAAVLEGLGYSRNRRGFRQLAARLPWSTLAEACPGYTAEAIEPVLWWASGLGTLPAPGTPSGDAAARIGRLPGASPEWATAVGRPQNRPEYRIRAAAVLAERWMSAGGPAACLEDQVLAAPRPRRLIEALTVRGAPGERSPMGAARASVIVINCVLPALHAIALEAGRWHVVERCLATYRVFPRLPSNSVERESLRILAQLGRSERVRGARGQQGLIYLYRSLTTR
ncbi:MAG: DUF2851 family protein [SAR202 cluster bacterium]|nr:DUF2851 family protein [SAR202 cluster bacterium]